MIDDHAVHRRRGTYAVDATIPMAALDAGHSPPSRQAIAERAASRTNGDRPEGVCARVEVG